MAIRVTSAKSNTSAVGGLFAGLGFFVVQRLPSRSDYVSKIQANGGRVVRLEAQADHIIADHLRKDCPPSSISYRFIDAAIRDGALPDPADHLAGPPPGSVREVGSVVPGKATRTPFTAEDDRVLWNWVQRLRVGGGAVKGNEIYKQLEVKNPRHTYQAWRDRYIKKLIDRPPAGVNIQVPANPPPSPPNASDAENEPPPATRRQPNGRTPKKHNASAQARSGNQRTESSNSEFTDEDFALLLDQAKDIEDIAPNRYEEAWSTWAEQNDQHSAHVWQDFYRSHVRPLFLKRQAEEKEARRRKRKARQDPEQVNLSQDADYHTAEEDHEHSTRAMRKRVKVISNLDVETSNARSRKRASMPKNTDSERTPNSEMSGSLDREPAQTDENDSSRVQRSKSPRSASNPPVGASKLSIDDDGDDIEIAEKGLIRAEGDVPSRQDIEQLNAGIAEVRKDLDDVQSSVLHTSEANRAADWQLRQESLELLPMQTVAASTLDVGHADGTKVQVEGAVSPVSKVNVASDGDVQVHLPYVEDPDKFVLLPDSYDINRGQDMLQEGTDVVVDYLANEPDLLTAKNLAAQQALHKERPVRAVDLQEDSENEDQTDFLQFLQGVTGQRAEPLNDGIDVVAALTLPLNTGLRSDQTDLSRQDVYVADGGYVPESDPADIILPAHPPVSSQSEIDDALETNLEWPDTPKRVQRTRQVHSQIANTSFETQIDYPPLSAMYLGQPLQLGHVVKSSVPLQQSRTDGDPDLPMHFFEDVHNADKDLQENCDDDSERESTPSQPNEPEAEEGDLDLTLVGPPGGWEDLSQPERLSSSRSQAVKVVDPKSALFDGGRTDVGHEEVEEIYSVSSSSSSSSSASSRSSEEPRHQPQLPLRATALDTQDILNAETQQPDFGMPLPPDSDDEREDLPGDPMQAPVPPMKGTLAPQASQAAILKETQTLDLSEDIDTFIMTMMVRRGFMEDAIVRALKASSMRPELAQLILLEESVGRGLPKDIAGIWTEEEDRAAEGGDAKKLRGLTDKHGWNEVQARQDFLRNWREAGE